MGEKFSSERIIDELKIKRPDLVVSGKPTGLRDKITVKSLLCDHTWSANCSNILYRNSGCPICYHSGTNIVEYRQKLYEYCPRIEVLSDCAVKTHQKMSYRCKDCGFVFEAYPSQFFVRLNGHGCPICGHKNAGMKLRLTQEEFENRVSKASPQIQVLGKYINCHRKVQCRCKTCDYIWDVLPNSIMHKGTACPRCRLSRGEREIAKWLDDMDIKYIREYKFDDCIDKNKLPFDFYIPEYKACIEFDGEQHFRPIEFFGGCEHLSFTIRHDIIKEQYCALNDIILWRIAYWEIDEINEELHIFLQHCIAKHSINAAA